MRYADVVSMGKIKTHPSKGISEIYIFTTSLIEPTDADPSKNTKNVYLENILNRNLDTSKYVDY